MPGPVSDSYDPEFSTGDNANAVKQAIKAVRDIIDRKIGNETLEDIVHLSNEYLYTLVDIYNTDEVIGRPEEVRYRIIRFCLNRALKTI